MEIKVGTTKAFGEGLAEAMSPTRAPGRALSLVLERGSGTAIVGGERVELPPREFKLLAELTTRPAEAIATAKLIESVWPEAPDTPPQELYVLVGRLRKFLGDDRREEKLIRNRRRFGYYLAAAPDDVAIVDGSELPSRVIDLETDDAPVEIDREMEPHAAPGPGTPLNRQRDIVRGWRPKRILVALGTAAALIAMSWLAGYVIARSRADHSTGSAIAHNRDQADHVQEPAPRSGRSPKKPHQKKKDPGRPAKGAHGEPLMSSQPVAIAPGNPAPQPRTGGINRTNQAQHTKTTRESPSVPPPTAYLYHLFDSETGDHFVTTDSNTASAKEGGGYRGGAIGRIYTSPPEGVSTKAITTNYGTAYVFVGSSPETKPDTATRALYYSTNNDGDFFYTTTAGEANQQGWDGTLIGYVGTL